MKRGDIIYFSNGEYFTDETYQKSRGFVDLEGKPVEKISGIILIAMMLMLFLEMGIIKILIVQLIVIECNLGYLMKSGRKLLQKWDLKKQEHLVIILLKN